MKEKLKDVVSEKSVEKNKFPTIVIIIVIAEFCERFSYSGMRAFLTLYLRSKLNFTDDGATEIYHIFSTLVYVFPIFGGILADNYLGKFRTILYMLFVYATGNILVAVAAIPHLALPTLLCTMIGLFMITVGTGGIKPCVTAFGGDQFTLPKQEKHLKIYFSVLYFSLCIGSLIAKTVSPILRSEVHCFGDKDCYSLAFGAPGFVVLMAIVIFVSFKSKYIIKEPEGNVVFDFVKCVVLGLRNKIMSRKSQYENSSHWLDNAENCYDQKFIEDVKKTLSILSLFTVLPIFWSLLDQLGSKWTLQATKMDGRFGFVTVKPDQIQVTGPIFILILIPLFQKYLYPFLEKRNILKNPLHKLTAGGVLAAIAFIVSGSLELYLQTTYPELPTPGHAQLRIFNGYSQPIEIRNQLDDISSTIAPLSRYVKKDFVVESERNITFTITGSDVNAEMEVVLKDNKAISYFIYDNNREYSYYNYEDDVSKSKSGFPVVRFLLPNNLTDRNITFFNENMKEVEVQIKPGIHDLLPVFASTYSIRINDTKILDNIEIESGGVYAIIINEDFHGIINANKLVISAANSISMIFILPQFFIISVAEVLFAVTGNEFAFKESPQSMKAVMTAVWLLTESVGNVIIIVITRLFVHYNQATQFFIFTGMMLTSITVFHLMGKGYQFRSDDYQNHISENSFNETLYQKVNQTDCIER